jgi:hypothetical protein
MPKPIIAGALPGETEFNRVIAGSENEIYKVP